MTSSRHLSAGISPRTLTWSAASAAISGRRSDSTNERSSAIGASAHRRTRRSVGISNSARSAGYSTKKSEATGFRQKPSGVSRTSFASVGAERFGCAASASSAVCRRATISCNSAWLRFSGRVCGIPAVTRFWCASSSCADVAAGSDVRLRTSATILRHSDADHACRLISLLDSPP